MKKGQLEVLGALFDNKTGRVEFMGSFGEDFDIERKTGIVAEFILKTI